MPEDDTTNPPARLVAPRVPTGVALLTAVVALLDAARGRMATVTAPAGFGKSTQVAAWAARDGRAVAWIDIEPADNDATILGAAVLEALGHLTGSGSGPVPEAPLSAEPSLLHSALGRAVRTCRTPFILVLDDVHLIDARGSIDLVEAIARNVPAPSTLVLISRAGPSPALTRVRVHRGLVDVTAAELALSPADAARMLEEMGVSIDAEAVDQLVQDTEGWPVGVRLAGLALLAEPERAAPLAASPVRHDQETANYLHEEWLRGMSADDVELLTRASILDWLSGPLCDHVLERSDTAAALHRLHDTRRIVIPLDRRHDSYRMHRLLRDVLEADLQRPDLQAVRRCHHRASEWFESEGDADRALHHALARRRAGSCRAARGRPRPRLPDERRLRDDRPLDRCLPGRPLHRLVPRSACSPPWPRSATQSVTARA